MLLVFEIVFHEAPLFVLYSQFKIFPTFPFKVSVGAELPVQIAVAPVIVPPLDDASTVTEATLELVAEQAPL